ncbi:MAG TPA: hypothetical protein VMU19_13215 [Bryobacteraceae bacterium]|nr:hypothetical protein [Bryobacteraceae bacterium]
MRKKLVVLLLMAAAAGVAQSSSGYVFFAPGGVSSMGYTSMTLHAGFGVDAVIAKGIAGNIEIGGLWPRQCFSDCVVGVFSPGGSYHFLHRKDRKLDPFAGGGYSRIFRDGHVNLYYFGGGLNYWAAKHFGVRAEFRDHVHAERYYSYFGFVEHYWGFRMGLAIR